MIDGRNGIRMGPQRVNGWMGWWNPIPKHQHIRSWPQYDPSQTMTTFVPLRLSSSSSSSSSMDQNDEETDRSLLTSSTLVPTTTAPPSLKEITDSFTESLQRIIQTMSIILQSQKQQEEPSDTYEVQQIVQDILQICDEYDEITNMERKMGIADPNNDWMERLRNINTSSDVVQEQILKLLHQSTIQLQKSTLSYQRYELLVQLMQTNYTTYITTAEFLCSDSRQTDRTNQIQRYELPNVQDVPYTTAAAARTTTTTETRMTDDSLVPDCTLNDMEYNDSLLDQILLYIFRSLVTKHTNGVTSPVPGIRGLLEQGRTYMVQQKDHPPDAQHRMVQNTLRDLMTPILPPFYRIFMSGIIPKVQLPFNNNNDNIITLHAEEKQYGPWFYAPFLTSYITPIFFKFLVGPSHPNRHRETGAYGGLLVTKCKFLQESNCKGLCLHQCKIPAQNFFNTTLGLSLNVVPNFVTQECQWSFNEMPITPVSDDPSFPVGCIRGCTSRMTMNDAATTGRVGNICN